eukprot:6191550-Pleurochrysis_carterae.AAC.2
MNATFKSFYTRLVSSERGLCAREYSTSQAKITSPRAEGVHITERLGDGERAPPRAVTEAGAEARRPETVRAVLLRGSSSSGSDSSRRGTVAIIVRSRAPRSGTGW